MEKVTFEFFGFTLMEPLSSAMNWVLSLLCFTFYLKLKNQPAAFTKYWSWFFLLFTVSFFFGGLSHLFFDYVGMKGKIPGWTCAILAVSAGELAMLVGIHDPKKKQMLTSVVRAKVFATFVLLYMDLSFNWVMVHTAGFWVFVGIISVSRMRAGETNYKYFLMGMSFLFVIAAVKVGKVDLHPAWFNRDDIAHFIMLGMYWMYFRGVSALSKPEVQLVKAD